MNINAEIGFPESHAGVSADEFRAAFRNHPAGVALITADAGMGPVAMTATSVFSVSVEPPLLVFSVSDQSSASATLCVARTVVVHLLGAEQVGLAELGATSGIDRFADTAAWSRLDTGEPYFLNAPTRVRGRVVARHVTGAATVLVVHALDAKLPESEEGQTPLVYHHRTWHRLHEGSRIN